MVARNLGKAWSNFISVGYNSDNVMHYLYMGYFCNHTMSSNCCFYFYRFYPTDWDSMFLWLLAITFSSFILCTGLPIQGQEVYE